ncbi:MAG TPA: M20/M25/M40 family metallo-hydrolase [Terriglobia bacterium]|nr:M20/M25/M40 family metallo-hydrolase [Terriglobia bacterium]
MGKRKKSGQRVNTPVTTRAAQAPTSPPLSALPAVMTLLLIAALLFLAIDPTRPPAPVSLAAPPTEFSSGRALGQLKSIAQRPHPTGSPENDQVRLYIVRQFIKLRLQPLVQVTTVARTEPKWHGPIAAATVQNIVARMKGTHSSKAVMLVAHYDSVPSGPGASDDGSGVVTLLETARALKAGPRLKNDVIFLATDAEELGLLGSQAFVDQHAWAKDVGVVLNFEARGACGPSFMFETSAGNGWLIQQLARAAPHAVTSSFTYEAYKRLPNDTDLTVFKHAGLAGLNFAYVGCWPRYHTARDDLAHISERSVQHDGSQALALARRFGNEDLTHTKAPDAVYFSLFGRVIHYPQRAAIPLAILAALLFLAVLALGFKKRLLTWRGLLAGLVGWLVATGAALGICELLWLVLKHTPLVSFLPYGMAYNGDLYAYAFLALTIAVLVAFYALLGRQASVAAMTLGALVWWAILAVAAAIYAPGGSYLFTWPLLASALELGYAFLRRDPEGEEESALVWTLPAIVGIMLFASLPYFLLMLLSTTGLFPILLTTALLVGYLAPQIHIITMRRRWWLAGAAATAAVILLIAGAATSGYNTDHPRADSILYSLDADTGKAVWASGDRAPDAWASQLLKGTLAHGKLSDFVPLWALPTLSAHAPVLPLAPPVVEATGDATFGDIRELRLQITSPRQARTLWVEVANARILEAEVNGRKVSGAVPVTGNEPGNQHWSLVYTGLPKQGIALTLQFKASESPTMKVVDESDGLPVIPGISFQPRPDNLMATPPPWLDSSTLVSKTFSHFQMAMPH